MAKKLIYLFASMGVALANSAYSTNNPYEGFEGEVKTVIDEAFQFGGIPTVGRYKEADAKDAQGKKIADLKREIANNEAQIDALGANFQGLMLAPVTDTETLVKKAKIESNLATARLELTDEEANQAITEILEAEDAAFRKVCQNAHILLPLAKLMTWYISHEEAFSNFDPHNHNNNWELYNNYHAFGYRSHTSTLASISGFSRNKVTIKPEVFEHAYAGLPENTALKVKFLDIRRMFREYDISKVNDYFNSVNEVYEDLKDDKSTIKRELKLAQKGRNASLEQLALIQKAQKEGKTFNMQNLNLTTELGNSLSIIATNNNQLVKMDIIEPMQAEKLVKLNFVNKVEQLKKEFADVLEKLSVIKKIKDITDDILEHIKKHGRVS